MKQYFPFKILHFLSLWHYYLAVLCFSSIIVLNNKCYCATLHIKLYEMNQSPSLSENVILLLIFLFSWITARILHINY